MTSYCCVVIEVKANIIIPNFISFLTGFQRLTLLGKKKLIVT